MSLDIVSSNCYVALCKQSLQYYLPIQHKWLLILAVVWSTRVGFINDCKVNVCCAGEWRFWFIAQCQISVADINAMTPDGGIVHDQPVSRFNYVLHGNCVYILSLTLRCRVMIGRAPVSCNWGGGRAEGSAVMSVSHCRRIYSLCILIFFKSCCEVWFCTHTFPSYMHH